MRATEATEYELGGNRLRSTALKAGSVGLALDAEQRAENNVKQFVFTASTRAIVTTPDL